MSGLVRYDAMCRAIDDCHAVDEVEDIRDKALAIEEYMRRAKNPEPERRAGEIRLRAERKAGQLLKRMDRAERGRPSKTSDASTLNDLGVSHDRSARWQRLADVPEAEFEAALTAPEKPSTTGVIRKGALPKTHPPEKSPMDPAVLWLWGRVLDFERDGLLERDLRTIFTEMTETMRTDICAAWRGPSSIGLKGRPMSNGERRNGEIRASARRGSRPRPW